VMFECLSRGIDGLGASALQLLGGYVVLTGSTFWRILSASALVFIWAFSTSSILSAYDANLGYQSAVIST
jgi:hypothetical protein